MATAHLSNYTSIFKTIPPTRFWDLYVPRYLPSKGNCHKEFVAPGTHPDAANFSGHKPDFYTRASQRGETRAF